MTNSEKLNRLALVFATAAIIYATVWTVLSLTTDISHSYKVMLQDTELVTINRWWDILFFSACATIGFGIFSYLMPVITKWNWAAPAIVQSGFAISLILTFTVAVILSSAIPMGQFAGTFGIAIVANLISSIVPAVLMGDKKLVIGGMFGGIAGGALAAGLVAGFVVGFFIIIIEVIIAVAIITMLHAMEPEFTK